MIVPRLAASLVLASILLAACDSDDRRVTFGLGPRVESGGTTQEAEPSTFEPRASGDLPRGERRKVVAGAQLASRPDPDLELGSVLDVDFDGDRDVDALVVLRSDSSAELAVASRDGQGFSLETLARVPMPEGCTAGAARIELPEPRAALARLAHACAHGTSETIWALELGRRPRVRETIRLLPPAEGDAPLSVTTKVRDIDGDGRQDLEALVGVAGFAPLPLAWLDRPGGFGLNRDEPAASLRRIIGEAEAKVASAPEEAKAKAEEALALHRALCREGGAPRIALGDAAGVQCDLGPLPLRAEAIVVATLVRKGELLAALDAEGKIRGRPGFREVSTALLAPAWAAAPAPEGLVGRSVLSAEPLGGRAEALASLFFANDRALIVRGPLTRRVSLEGAPRVEVVLDPGPPIRDAQGALAVLDVRRRCGSTTATIVHASAATHPVDAVTPVAEPVIAAEPPPPGTRCQGGFEPAEPPYDFTVLGFAPQGLVAARLGAVRVVPLTVAAQPAGEPQQLGATTPLPAPIHGALVTPDGAVYVLPSSHGLVRIERATGGVMLLRAPEWTQPAPILAGAIAPNGRRAAVLRGGAVWVLDF